MSGTLAAGPAPVASRRLALAGEALAARGGLVLVAVALPARREGRDLLTPHGEDVVARVRERTGTVAAVTRERTGDRLASPDRNLLLYYRNRLDGYGLEGEGGK